MNREEVIKGMSDEEVTGVIERHINCASYSVNKHKVVRYEQHPSLGRQPVMGVSTSLTDRLTGEETSASVFIYPDGEVTTQTRYAEALFRPMFGNIQKGFDQFVQERAMEDEQHKSL